MNSYTKMTKTELIQVLEKITAPQVHAPNDIVNVLRDHFPDNDREYFLTASLNGAHKIVNIHTVTMGLVNRTLVHPREVFRQAITDNATAIIVAHNHPSGNLEPSPEDDEITKRLKSSGEILGIPILDHIILTECNSYSYLENRTI